MDAVFASIPAGLLFQHLRLTNCHALALTSRGFSTAFKERVEERTVVLENLAWRWGSWTKEVFGNGVNQLACNFTGQRKFPLPVCSTPDDKRPSYYPALYCLLDDESEDNEGVRGMTPSTCWMRQWDPCGEIRCTGTSQYPEDMYGQFVEWRGTALMDLLVDTSNSDVCGDPLSDGDLLFGGGIPSGVLMERLMFEVWDDIDFQPLFS